MPPRFWASAKVAVIVGLLVLIGIGGADATGSTGAAGQGDVTTTVAEGDPEDLTDGDGPDGDADREDGESPAAARDVGPLGVTGVSQSLSVEPGRPIRTDRPPRLAQFA